jgi:hypothetical protein
VLLGVELVVDAVELDDEDDVAVVRTSSVNPDETLQP